MLKVHLADGRTLSLEMSDAACARELAELRRSGPLITSAEIVKDGHAYALGRPGTGAGGVELEAETGEHGERVRLFADGLLLSMMVHARRPAVRFSVEHGRRVWRPRE